MSVPCAAAPGGGSASELRLLCEELSGIEDFQRGQGRRHSAAIVLAACVLGRPANMRGPAAEYAGKLPQKELEALGAWRNPKTGLREPVSKSTMHRVAASLDPEQIEAALRRFSVPRVRLGRAVAVDEKCIRGANRNGGGRHGTAALVDHATGAPPASLACNDEGGEIAAVRTLLGKVPLKGFVAAAAALQPPAAPRAPSRRPAAPTAS